MGLGDAACMTIPHTDNSVQVSEPEDGYMLCDLQELLVEVQWLACMSIETTFLLEVSTAKS